jgi:ribosomal protein S18 acetylase RimI-like enzyme
MRLVSLHDRAAIEAVLRRDPALHLYALGDLDPFFWPLTTWYGLDSAGAVLLLYHGSDPPTLLALSGPPVDPLTDLLRLAGPLLPPVLYAHLTPAAADALRPRYHIKPHGRHLKMALTDPGRAAAVDTSAVVPLTPADRDELLAFYAVSYPRNWFNPRMLETGCYYGTRDADGLAAVAGVHVYSPAYRAAALGNIATHPRARGRGLGAAVTARLCQALTGIDHVGLNVKADNEPAIRCYRRVGFEPVAEYDECTLTATPSHPAAG